MSAYRGKNGPSTSAVQDRLNTVSQRLNFFLPMNHPAVTNTPPQQQQAPQPQQQQQQHFANGNGNGNNGMSNVNGNGGNGTTSANGEDPQANYTLQGVMQWLNGEYRRCERERNNWEIERAALVAQVSHLMGTKVGTQKVQEDLMRQNKILERRIKVLESALRTERYPDTGKVSDFRAKNNGEKVEDEMSPVTSPPPQEHVDIDITPLLTHPDRQRSRKLLESCLREINYLMSQPTSLPPTAMNPNLMPPNDIHPAPATQEWPQQREMAKPQLSSSEEISYIGIDNDPPPQDEELPRKLPKKVPLTTESNTKSQDSMMPIPQPEQIPRPPSPKLNTVLERSPAPRSSAQSAFQDSPSSTRSATSPSSIFKSPFAHFKDTSRVKDASISRTFINIHTLRSHLLPIRALIPCSTASTQSDETCFISAADDSTVKFWRVNNRPPAATIQKRKAGNFDILPQITFRGHSGMVTCLAEGGGFIWSGGVDSSIRGWCVPPATRDAYGSSTDASAVNILEGHTNCIWSLAVPASGQPLLASASADSTVKIWDTRLNSRSPLRASFSYPPQEKGKDERVNPTCVSWDWEGRGVIIGWENEGVEMWDVERSIATLKLLHNDDSVRTGQVNCFVKHPTENLVIAGYEDRHIRVFDPRTNDCIASWAAHLDSVTSLAISPNGKTLLSGAHDASVRFWDFSDKSCLQEAFPPHRQRGDEGVLAVAWGEDEVCGSAGADGVVKLYVEQ